MTTVDLSGVSRLSTGEEALRLFEMSTAKGDREVVRSQLHFTSAASIARPEVGGRGSKRWFGRSLKVSRVASGDSSQDSAASPVISSGPGIVPRGESPCLTRRL